MSFMPDSIEELERRKTATARNGLLSEAEKRTAITALNDAILKLRLQKARTLPTKVPVKSSTAQGAKRDPDEDEWHERASSIYQPSGFRGRMRDGGWVMRVRDAEKERYAKGPGLWLKPNERVCTACRGYRSILLPGQRSNPEYCRLCKATGKLPKVAKATDGGKTAYVKEPFPADVMSSDNSHSTGMRRLSAGTELTAFQQSDKGVFFKDSSGTIYHIRLDECNRYLSKTKAKAKDRAALHRALDAALDGALPDKQFLDLLERVAVEYASTAKLRWPGDADPKTQAASEAAYAASKARIKGMLQSAGTSPQEFKKRAHKAGVPPSKLRFIDAL